MATVTFERLRLEGFGQFAEPVEVHFQQGVNVVIAPNERGKSTIVAGIGAVLFGVEQSEDATRFSQGRFRCWYEHSRFRGELELYSDGKLYLITRDLTNNHVQFSFKDKNGASWQSLREHRHNPRARKRIPDVDNLLRSLLGGIGHLKLFEATFCVPQALPMESQLSHELQRLLSGGDTYQRALERLRDQAKVVTRHTKDLGLTEQDARKEGRIEQLEQEMQRLRKQLEDSRTTIEELHCKQEFQRKLNEEEQSLTRTIENLERRIDTYKRWTELYSQYQVIVQEQRFLEETFNQLQRRQNELARLREELEKCPNWCRQADDPVTFVRDAKEHWENLLRDWEGYVQHKIQFEKLDEQIKNRYKVFEQASDEERELLERYETERLRREGQCKQKELELQRLREPLEYFNQEQSRYDKEFGEIDSLPPDALQSLEEKIDILSQLSDPPRIRWVLFVSLILSGAGLATLAALAGLPKASVMVATCFWAAALVLQVRQLQRQRRAETEWREYQEQLQRLNQNLGPVAEVNGIAELAVLCQRLRMRDERKRFLDDLRRQLPSEEIIQQTQKELEDSRKHLQDFVDRMQDYVDIFKDEVQNEFNRYLSLRKEREALDQRLSEYAQRFDEHWPHLPEKHCENLAEPFGLLKSEMGLPNSRMSYGQLMECLSKLTDEFWQGVKQKAEDCASLRQNILMKQKQLEEILHRESQESLQARKIDAQNRAMKKQSDLDALTREIPDLPRQYDKESEAKIHQLLRSAESELREKKSHKEDLLRRLQETEREIGRLEGQGTVNIAKVTEEIAALEQEKEQLKFELTAVSEAYRAMQKAAHDFNKSHRQDLAQCVSQYFARFTGGNKTREVSIDENFRLRVFEGEREIDLSQLSRGAIDQLYLAVRFAVADFLTSNVRLPFIFDDSFVHCDKERRNSIRQALDEVAKERQVIIFSHDEDFNSWGNRVEVTRLPTQN